MDALLLIETGLLRQARFFCNWKVELLILNFE
jgi:hypothetical protein